MKEFEEIIKGCKAGKRAAQSKLFARLSKKMFGVCMIYTKDTTAAEDVLHEGFIKVFKNIKQFCGKGSFEGWVRRIMVNTALERYRKEQRMYSVSQIEDYIEDISYDDIVSDISARDLMAMIKELSPRYKVAFSLYAIEGYSHKEISQKLNISEGTSKSNVSRARKILQEKIKKQYGYAVEKSIV